MPDFRDHCLPPDFSDHCMGALLVEGYKGNMEFFNFLIKHPSFLQTVSQVWSSYTPYGINMYVLYKKITALKPALGFLNK